MGISVLGRGFLSFLRAISCAHFPPRPDWVGISVLGRGFLSFLRAALCLRFFLRPGALAITAITCAAVRSPLECEVLP